MDCEKAYALLVGRISNAIDEIERSRVTLQGMENAIKMLKEGLEETEEMY